MTTFAFSRMLPATPSGLATAADAASSMPAVIAEGAP